MYTAMVMMCLGMSLGQLPAPPGPPTPASPLNEPEFYNQTSFKFPLMTRGRKADIREMRLYVSTDEGKSWQQKAVVAGDHDHIVFTAEADGPYWLQIAAVGIDGRQEPENIYQAPPEHIRKMVIDTLKPFIKIVSAQRHGEEIHLAWEILEKHPDWSKFKVEYQVQPSPQWTEVPVTPGHEGHARFRAGEGTVTLRIRLHDKAGNTATAMTEIAGNGSFAQGPPSGLKLAAGQEPVFPPSDVPPPPVPPVGDAGTPPQPKPYAPPPSPKFPAEAPPYAPPPWSPGAAANEPNHHYHEITRPAETPAPPPWTGPRAKNLPALVYVNSPEVTLEYELKKVGPSGVGSVDFWWTRNDGQSWEKYAYDPEAKGTGKQQRTVELPGDGIYGFLIVVKSRAGMGRPEPRPGDAPEIRVEVDTKAPFAELYPPTPDSQRSNALILTWLAKDKNMGTHPITLEWSERRDGDWKVIAANLPNSGRYSWQLPDQLPVQVYLRVRARDCAGNEGFFTTPEPQVVDLSVPEGRIINIRR